MTQKLASLIAIVFVASLGSSQGAFAGAQVGTLTQVSNGVKIFSHPGKKVKGPKPHALFEGTFYSVRPAKVGDRVENGNILQTRPGSKARVVYNNGDQFNVGGGTAYRIDWSADSKSANKAKPRVNLYYGKLRGILSKKGPRSRTKIRTQSATMGVRGTDFFVAHSGANNKTEYSVIRGKVEVKPNVKKAKPVKVKAGFSARVETRDTKDAIKEKADVAQSASTKKQAQANSQTKKDQKKEIVPIVRLEKTTKEELVAIDKSTRVEIKKEIARTDQEVSARVKKEVKKLEAKAVKTTLEDIKRSDKKLYAKLTKNKKVKDSRALNTQAVTKLVEKAPAAPKNRKPFLSEMGDLGADVYDDYFKVVD